MANDLHSLLGLEIPIIQAGMVWCSGWKLASAVSNAGALGVIGAGSMYPDTLLEHIRKCKAATSRPFAVNVPLLYPEMEAIIKVLIEEQIRIVITSAGNPATWTNVLKKNNMKVIHVVSSVKFARKAEDSGVDAVVAEGFEAGGHNGREETTTFVLVPMVAEAVQIPVIAAGGIYDGRSMVAAEVLGAKGFQVGSRFAVATESSAHEAFKNKVTSSGEGETVLTLKQLTPVRLLKNKFYEQVRNAELAGATPSELATLLGTRRARKGIFEGNLEEGELEIGQVSARVNKSQSAAEIVNEMWAEYCGIKKKLRDEFHQD